MGTREVGGGAVRDRSQGSWNRLSKVARRYTHLSTTPVTFCWNLAESDLVASGCNFSFTK